MTVFVIDARFTTRMTELRAEIFGKDFPATGMGPQPAQPCASASFLCPARGLNSIWSPSIRRNSARMPPAIFQAGATPVAVCG
jgi:hypothetical protein